MSRTLQLLHIVINTKDREMVIPEKYCQDLYSVLANLVKSKRGYVYCINGIRNHIHLLIDNHPTVALQDLMRHIKQNSSLWMTKSGLYPNFRGWGQEYFACSVSPAIKDKVAVYIANQKNHHMIEPFEHEYRKLILNAGHEWNEYLLT